MTSLPEVQGVTIDDRSTRDMDDAIWVETGPSGSPIVTVSVANAAFEVTIGGVADERARQMTATRYFATGNSPMLPRTLAEDELSLLPGKSRHVLAVRVVLDDTYSPRRTEVFEARLRSAARLSYDEIPAILGKLATTAPSAMVVHAAGIATDLLNKRRARGALALYDLNHGWVTTEEGAVRTLNKREDTIGYVIVQELMILANAALAAWSVERDVPVLFRNHVARAATPPDRAQLLADLDSALTRPLADLESYRERTHMLLGRAEYDVFLRGHFGLNVPAYMHATSPIRRYADLVNHRQIVSMLEGVTPVYTADQLGEIAAHINSVAEEERERTKEAMKSKAEGVARRAALSDRMIEGLDPKKLERVVKLEARSGAEISGALLSALELRLKEDRMPLACRTVVFTEAPRTPGWDALRGSIVRAMASRPEDAVSLFAMASQTAGWPLPIYDSSDEGAPHARVFRTAATIQFPDTIAIVTGERETASTAARAKQRAAISLLATIAGIPCPPEVATRSGGVRVQVDTTKSAAAFCFDLARDAVPQLMEYGQATGLAVAFAFEQSGPPHAPLITCVCHLGDVEAEAIAGNKKDAKRMAAASVVRLLKDKTR